MSNVLTRKESLKQYFASYYPERFNSRFSQVLRDNEFRQRWLASHTSENDSVLDVGCSAVFNPYIKGSVVAGLDYLKPLPQVKKHYSPFYIADLDDDVTLERCFDVVLMGEVLEHCEDPVGALRRIKNVLKPGGRLALTTPNCVSPQKVWNAIRGASDPLLNHVIEFNASTLAAVLKIAGFQDVKIKAGIVRIPLLSRLTKRAYDIMTPFGETLFAEAML